MATACRTTSSAPSVPHRFSACTTRMVLCWKARNGCWTCTKTASRTMPAGVIAGRFIRLIWAMRAGPCRNVPDWGRLTKPAARRFCEALLMLWLMPYVDRFGMASAIMPASRFRQVLQDRAVLRGFGLIALVAQGRQLLLQRLQVRHLFGDALDVVVE